MSKKQRTLLGRSGALLSAIAVLISISIASFIPALTGKASAANVEQTLNVYSGIETPSQPGYTPIQPMFSKPVKCFPVLNRNIAPVDVIQANKIPVPLNGGNPDYSTPFQKVQNPPTDNKTPGGAPTGTAAKAYNSAKSSSYLTNVITFESADNRSACEQAGMFFQYPANSATFYGVFSSAVLVTDFGGDYQYVALTATVKTSGNVGTISFHDPMDDFSRVSDPSQTFPAPPGIDYSDQIASWQSSVLGGSTSTGKSCPSSGNMADVQTQDQSNSCVAQYSQGAHFVSQNTIWFAGSTFTSTHWGASNSDWDKFTLTDAGLNPGWGQCGKSYIQFTWEVNGISGSLNITTLSNFKKFMEGAGFINADLYNINCHKGSPGYKSTFRLDATNLNAVAHYNPADNTVNTVYSVDQADGNEAQVLGTYAYAPPSVQYMLPTGGSGCQGDGARPYFTFDRILTDKSLKEGDYVSGVWHMDQKSDCSKFTDVKITVLIGAPSDTAPVLSDTGKGDNLKDTAPKLDCHVSIFNPLSWFLCPIAAGLATIAGALDNAINNALYFDTNHGDTKMSNYQQPFNAIRNISLGLIGVGALVAIVSQAAGFEIFDAYTIRKVLPRLFVCALGISLAWPLMAWFIGLTNDLGIGIRQLIYLGANHNGTASQSILSGGGETVAGILATESIISLGFVGLLTFAATAALAASVAYLVLILRQMVIVFLIIFAPLAIAAYLLPNTQKAWKFWWDAFSKALLMFPIITGFIALGRTFATYTGDNLISFVAYFAPYFLIPLTFRFAGGLLGTLGGFVNDRSRGAFDGLKNIRKNQQKQNRAARMERAQNNALFTNPRGGKIRNALNRTAQEATLIGAGGGALSWQKRRARMVNERNKRERLHAAKALEQDEDVKNMALNDMLLEAGMHGEGNERDVREYLSTKYGQSGAQLERNVQAVMAAKRKLGNKTSAFKQMAVLANASTNTGLAGGWGDAAKWINEAAEGDDVLRGHLIAQVKDRMSQAGRPDAAGVSFSELWTQTKWLENHGNSASAVDAVNADVAAKALEAQGAGAIISARGTALKNLMPTVFQRAQNAQTAVTMTQEYAVERQASQDLEVVNADLQTAREAQARARTKLEDVRNQVTQGGEATAPQQQAIAQALANLKAADAEVNVRSGHVQVAQQNYANARTALENTDQHRNLMHEMASLSAMHDVTAQVAPEKSRELADNVLSQFVTDAKGNQIIGANGQPMTLQDIMEDSRQYAAFQREHKEYTAVYGQQANAAQTAAAAAVAGTPGAIPQAPGALGGPPGSDRRLKRNIVHLATTTDGIKLYRFQYLWSDQTYVGVMAQDLVDTHPEALSLNPRGYYLVNYATLGLEMLTLEEWQSIQTTLAGRR